MLFPWKKRQNSLSISKDEQNGRNYILVIINANVGQCTKILIIRIICAEMEVNQLFSQKFIAQMMQDMIFKNLFKNLNNIFIRILYFTIIIIKGIFKVLALEMSQKNQNIELLDKRSQNQENQKEQKLIQVYFCSCGKQYRSFAATYLHFRARHNIKLSTKANEKRRVVKIQGDIKKIIYKASHVRQSASTKRKRELSLLEQYYEEEQQKIFDFKEPPPNLRLKKIKSCVKQYLTISKNQYSSLYEKLLNYLIIESHGLNLPQSAFQRENIPYLFNNFILSYLPKNDESLIIGSQQWDNICRELGKFSDWMYEKKYTKILVMPNK